MTNEIDANYLMSYTLSLDSIKGMIAPYALHTILELQKLIESHEDDKAFIALKNLVRQFTVGFTSVIHGFWQFYHSIKDLPHHIEYQTEVKKLFMLAKAYTNEQMFI